MNYCSGCGYSGLESAVSSYSGSGYQAAGSGYCDHISYLIKAAPLQNISVYEFKENGSDPYSARDLCLPKRTITRTYYSSVDDWLIPDRQVGVFVGDANEVKELVEEAFRAVTGKEFPRDVVIRVLDKENFCKAHSSFRFGDGVQGFAINRKMSGLVSEVFVRKDELAKVMLTLGHEIGHVLSRKLDNEVDEEAKAFAFSLAWMKAVKEKNIGNLATAIRLDRPAANGLHDIALDSVLKEVNEGRDAFDVYLELIAG